MITYGDHMTGAEYIYLRDAVGFGKISIGQATRGIDHTTFLVAAREDKKIVGMARVLYDFGYTAYIADVIVRPEYQKQGIGKCMMGKILEFLNTHSGEGEFMLYALNAAKDKEGFYEKLGFEKRPTAEHGAGMTMTIR